MTHFFNENRFVVSPSDYQVARARRMIEYLNSLREEAITINKSDQIVNVAYNCLQKLCGTLMSHNKVLEIPDCCPNNGTEGDFHIMFTWDKDEHYLECEVLVDGTAEFFYSNRLSKEVWGEDYLLLENKLFSDNVLFDKLSYFVE